MNNTLKILAKLTMDKAALKLSDSDDANKKIKYIQKKIDHLTKPFWMN